jgi:hypothetical protein
MINSFLEFSTKDEAAARKVTEVTRAGRRNFLVLCFVLWA